MGSFFSSLGYDSYEPLTALFSPLQYYHIGFNPSASINLLNSLYCIIPFMSSSKTAKLVRFSNAYHEILMETPGHTLDSHVSNKSIISAVNEKITF